MADYARMEWKAVSDAEGTGLIIRAAQFSAWKHRHQRRKSQAAEPYINHPLDLAHVLWFEGKVHDPTVIAAALLHDTIEDTQTTFGELQGEFGNTVASLVMEVTDEPSVHWRLRKRLQISRAKGATWGAKQIKLADKICNLRDMVASTPKGWSIDRVRNYFDWSKEVIDQIRRTNPLLERKFDNIYLRRP